MKYISLRCFLGYTSYYEVSITSFVHCLQNYNKDSIHYHIAIFHLVTWSITLRLHNHEKSECIFQQTRKQSHILDCICFQRSLCFSTVFLGVASYCSSHSFATETAWYSKIPDKTFSQVSNFVFACLLHHQIKVGLFLQTLLHSFQPYHTPFPLEARHSRYLKTDESL